MTYRGAFPITYTVAQLQQMSWQGWFNPTDMAIKSSLTGKVINSYFNMDEVIQQDMRANDMLHRMNQHFNRVSIGWRTASNLSQMPFLLSAGNRQWNYTKDDLNVAAGATTMLMADRNIDAGAYGWSNGGTLLPLDGHSCFKDMTYTSVYRWWREVFSGGDNSSMAAVRLGQE